MARLHHTERRRRGGELVALVAASIALAAGCSGSTHPTDTATPATASTIAPVTASTIAATTTSTLPSAPSSTSVSSANGVVTVKGRGDRTVALPRQVALPVIVHARHRGPGSFVISGVHSIGTRTAVLASSLGSYDGTFPVGFVDPAGGPTVALHIATRGSWQIDVGNASRAPRLEAGQAGVGDTVLAYLGPATTAHLTFRSRSMLIVNMYESGGFIPLVRTKGPYDGPISLVGGPAFIAVTTTGKWSMIIG